ncbi:hypothetical protein AAGS61_08095 [Lysinibacillus sp. KU-BSD001]|uniref:hypothetical protein n=1 Tax=Lysinibacillus sp. KU-BSD001 TaxID=3141328 RepID=UPI0036EBE069
MKRRLITTFGTFIVFFWLFGNAKINQHTASNQLEEYAPGEVGQLGELAFTAASEVLNREDFGRLVMLMDPQSPQPYLEIILADLDEISIEKIHQLQQLVAEAVYAQTNKDFSITIRTKSDEERLDEEWQPIFTIIGNETEKNFEAYRGFAYSFSPAPLEIIIKTHLSHSAQQQAKEIKAFVAALIEQHRQVLSVEDIPYEIIIRDEDHQPFHDI